MRSFTAIRKDAGLYCGSLLRKGEVFTYVGLPQNLKDLKDGRDVRSLDRIPEVMSPDSEVMSPDSVVVSPDSVVMSPDTHIACLKTRS